VPDQKTGEGKGPRPLVEDMLAVAGADGGPHLIVSRCEDCGALAFPARSHCASCYGQSLGKEEAPGEGTLYTFTVVREIGRAREGFVPYAVGQVDLGNGVRVMGIITAAPDSLSIGMPVRTTLVPQGKDEDGNELVGYAFAPTAE
jgi:uncharacterized OB-fold protein